jgi:hypothetical protein
MGELERAPAPVFGVLPDLPVACDGARRRTTAEKRHVVGEG